MQKSAKIVVTLFLMGEIFLDFLKLKQLIDYIFMATMPY